MKTGSLLKNIFSILVYSSVAVEVASADVPALTVSSNQFLSGSEVKNFVGINFFCSNTGTNQNKTDNACNSKLPKDDWKTQIYRVALDADGDNAYTSAPGGNTAQVETLIDAAIANDKYVIITYHTQYAVYKKAEAAAFFEQMALKYGSHNNVIYEIYSEPFRRSWNNEIKPYAEDIISAIRSIDPDNLIIVDTPNISQNVYTDYQYPIMGNNIAYTRSAINPRGSMTAPDSSSSGTYESMVVSSWYSTSETTVDPHNSTESGDLVINLINIEDLVDVVVDVDTNVDKDTDVLVDVITDVSKLIDGNDQGELSDKIMSDDLVNAVDLILSNDLASVINEIITNDSFSVIDQILSSNLYAMVNQNGLSSQSNSNKNSYQAQQPNLTDLTNMLEQVETEVLISFFENVVELLKIIDQTQSEDQANLSTNNTSSRNETYYSLQSDNQLDILTDVIALIEVFGQVEPDTDALQADLMALISLISLLIQNDTTEKAITSLPAGITEDLPGILFDSTITRGLSESNIPVTS
jgi:hypothetical protein